jgi:hypothetical protein
MAIAPNAATTIALRPLPRRRAMKPTMKTFSEAARGIVYDILECQKYQSTPEQSPQSLQGG